MWERRTFHTRMDDATREIDPETYRSIGNILRILRNVTNSSLSPSINAMKLNGVAPHVSFIGDEIFNSWPDILLWRSEDHVEARRPGLLQVFCGSWFMVLASGELAAAEANNTTSFGRISGIIIYATQQRNDRPTNEVSTDIYKYCTYVPPTTHRKKNDRRRSKRQATSVLGSGKVRCFRLLFLLSDNRASEAFLGSSSDNATPGCGIMITCSFPGGLHRSMLHAKPAPVLLENRRVINY